jgi:hypothetical protein
VFLDAVKLCEEADACGRQARAGIRQGRTERPGTRSLGAEEIVPIAPDSQLARLVHRHEIYVMVSVEIDKAGSAGGRHDARVQEQPTEGDQDNASHRGGHEHHVGGRSV